MVQFKCFMERGNKIYDYANQSIFNWHDYALGSKMGLMWNGHCIILNENGTHISFLFVILVELIKWCLHVLNLNDMMH